MGLQGGGESPACPPLLQLHEVAPPECLTLSAPAFLMLPILQHPNQPPPYTSHLTGLLQSTETSSTVTQLQCYTSRHITVFELFILFFKSISFFIDCPGSFCVPTFFSCSEQGLLSSCDAWASHCGGSSCWGARTVGPQGLSSRIARAP